MEAIIKHNINKKIIHTVAGIIENEQGEILCCKRDVGKYPYVSLKWEYPGGKIEKGETSPQALHRELQEELNIKVNIENQVCTIEHEYPDFYMQMEVFKCNMEKQPITLNVHKEMCWKKPDRLVELDWADADWPITEKINDEYLSKERN
jgi:ADP-ribose pyrophosphatase